MCTLAELGNEMTHTYGCGCMCAQTEYVRAKSLGEWPKAFCDPLCLFVPFFFSFSAKQELMFHRKAAIVFPLFIQQILAA